MIPLALVIFSMLFYNPRRSLPSAHSQTQNLLLLGFLLSLLFSSFFSQSFIDSWEILNRWLAAISLIFLWPFINRKNSVFIVASLVIAVGTLLSLISLILPLVNYSPPISDSYTFLSLINGHNQLSNYLVISIPLTLSLYLQNPKSYRYLLLPLLIMLLAFIATLARGAWVIMLLYPLIYLFVYPEGLATIRRLLLPFFMISLVVAVLLFINYKTEIVSSAPVRVRSFSNITKQPLNLNCRLDYFKEAVNRFKSYPLTGTGLGTYEFIGETAGYTVFAHNFHLQLLSETGLISTLLFGIILLHFFVQLYSKARSNPHPIYKAIFVSLGLSLFYSMIDFGWNYWVIFLTVLTLLLVSTSEAKTPSKNSPARYAHALTSGVILFQIGLVIIKVAAGATSYYYQNKALAAVSSDPNQAAKLYSLSLDLYPYNREAFYNSLKFFDQNDSDRAELVTSKWVRLDKGNGNTYQHLAERAYKNNDLPSSLRYLLLAIDSPFQPTINFPFIFELLGKAKNDSYASLQGSAEVISALDRKFNGSFLSNFYYNDYLVTYSMIEGLTDSPYFHELNSQYQSLIYYHSAVGQIYRDSNDWNLIAQYCQKVTWPEEPKRICSQLQTYSSFFLNQQNITALEEQINQLEPGRLLLPDKKELSLRLTALMYQEKAKLYQQSGNSQSEIAAMLDAINTHPQLASIQLRLIHRYHTLNEEEKSTELLNDCVERFGLICNQWYSDYLSRVSN